MYYIILSGSNINCNIFSYDYSGYGASSGRPSEKNLYADIEAAWNFLRTKYGVSPENIILYGQVGTNGIISLNIAKGLDGEKTPAKTELASGNNWVRTNTASRQLTLYSQFASISCPGF